MIKWIICVTVSAFVLVQQGLAATEYGYVIAPLIVRFNHTEDVLVGTFGNQRNQPFRVWCVNSRNKEFSIQTGSVKNKAEPSMTSIIVTENDLIDDTLTDKPRIFQICASVGGTALPCKDLWIDYKTGFMIVQTDKPVYTPEQKVRIRVLPVDESLKPMKDNTLTFEIISPSNQTLGRKRISSGSDAFYTHKFDLPPYPELGIWTASVGYQGQYETVGRALFKVMEYVLPTFEVSVSLDKDVILKNTEHVTVSVSAIYVFGKPVDGTASIMFNLTDKMGDSKLLPMALKRKLVNGKASFDVNITELFHDEQPFPFDKYLRVDAIVIEEVTGNEEEGYNDKTLIAEQYYKFSFARSKHTFHPTYDYHLKIDILKANGVVEKSPRNVTITHNGKTENVISSNGQILYVFAVPNQQTLTLQASIKSSVGEERSEDFTIYAYKGSKQIQLDILEREGKTFLDVSSDRQSNTDSGILVLGISRGKIVTKVFSEVSKTVKTNIDSLKRKLSPRARFVGVYINGARNSLEADALKVELDATCPGNGLRMVPQRTNCEPGNTIRFNITGDPLMRIGLSGIDVATLTFDNDNVLKPDRLFQELRERDRGCGQGGGLTSGEVLKHAGLQILINVNVEETDKSSPGDPECKLSNRHKRATMFCDGVNPICCEKGIAEAIAIMNGTTDDEKMKINAEAKCYAMSLLIADTLPDVPTSCIVAYFKSCWKEMEDIVSEVQPELSARSGLERTTQYELDLKTIGVKRLPTRTNFQESILFDDYVTLDQKGHLLKDVKYPDSITTWNFQAIGVTDAGKMCIAEPVETKVLKNFFIQLQLPYKAKKLELFEVKVTVFNYGISNEELSVNLYMAASPFLCYDGTANEESHQITIELGSNDAKSVTFPVMPLKAGKFKIKVTAVVADATNIAFDAVEKELLVENEGVQVRETIQICIDSFNRSKDCVDSKERVSTTYPNDNSQRSIIDLTLPDNAITGTGEATGYLQGNIMGSIIQTVISGTEAAFDGKPHGCGEQTMIYTAPSVFVLNYLKSTKQMTSDAETKGTENIRFGVNREISLFRHGDFSYSCCNKRAGVSNKDWFHRHTRPSSVWLTSFVMKVFCHAKRVVDDVLDLQNDLYRTLMWLVDHQKSNGKFEEIMTVNIQSMMGQMGSDGRTLTAFVLISLMECHTYHDVFDNTFNSSITAAQMYLENVDVLWLKQNPHGLAIITYALALCKSAKRKAMKDMLLSSQIYSEDIGTIHWESQGKGANAPNTETTSYALLAMLLYDDLETSAKIVRWLTLYQKPGGGSYSTQSTAISLQALSTYAIRISSPLTDIQVSLLGNGLTGKEYKLTNANKNLQTIINKLPVETEDNKLTLNATIKGGSGRMKIDLVYYRPATQTEVCAFNVSDIHVLKVTDVNDKLADLRKCDVCGYCALDPATPNFNGLANSDNNAVSRRKRAASDDQSKCVKFSVSSLPGDEYGMSIVKFGLQTGVLVIKEDLDKLIEDNENLFLYETPDNHEGYVVFYLMTLNSTQNDFTFRVKDSYNTTAATKTRQPAIVEVYDYYNDDINCLKLYGLNNNKRTTFDHTCDGNECKCISSVCARDVRSILIDKLRKDKTRKSAVISLKRYACNSANVGYVVVVIITKVYDNKNTGEKLADATLLNIFFDGGLKLDKQIGQKMVFYWPSHCTFPKLEEGQKYQIVGNERHMFKTPNNTKEPRYSLSGSTLVLEKLPKQKLLNMVLNDFGKVMREIGCRN